MDKQMFTEVLKQVRPDLADDAVDAEWSAFERIQARADKLKSAGCSIHPAFGTGPQPAAPEEPILPGFEPPLRLVDGLDGTQPSDAAAVLEIAGSMRLKHVVVIGIKSDGMPYMEADDGNTLAQLCWLSMVFSKAVDEFLGPSKLDV